MLKNASFNKATKDPTIFKSLTKINSFSSLTPTTIFPSLSLKSSKEFAKQNNAIISLAEEIVCTDKIEPKIIDKLIDTVIEVFTNTWNEPQF